MAEHKSNHSPKFSRFQLLQERVSIVAWSYTLLLSLRGIYIFYGMKEKGSIEQIVTFLTDPVVQLFRFERIESLDIPAIGVLFAAVSILLISQILQLGIRLTELRLARARKFMAQQVVHVSKQA
jgi:hypothetical protein